MNRSILVVLGLCLVLSGFAENATAGPVAVSAQESAQLSALAGQDALLTLKAGGSFPNAPRSMEATEVAVLRNLEAGKPDLARLKAGQDAEHVLILVAIVLVCVLLVQAVL